MRFLGKLALANEILQILKRVFQLTGRRIPDSKLNSIRNVDTLLRNLQKPPKPKTFTDEITKHKQDELVQLPNVQFQPKRVTRGDQEKALGRYKLIEKELRERGVLAKNTKRTREMEYFEGKA
jgi:hypothetical protein